MINAEILSTGTELLLGQTLNTNAQYLAQRLASLGIYCYFQTTVGDNPQRMKDALKIALQRSDLVITTGGLGPTKDDLTKEIVAELFGIPMETDQQQLNKIKAFFQQRGREMPPGNVKQAMLPIGSKVVPNHLGTAPGVILEHQRKIVIMLPGPPFEMKPMFEETAVPYLAEKSGTEAVQLVSRVLKVVGPGESVVEGKIDDILEGSNPTVALLARDSELHVRITARVKLGEPPEALIDNVENEIRRRLNPYVYGSDQETLGSVVGKLLQERNLTLTLAESCTGGLVASNITDVSGASKHFVGSFVAYSNVLKSQLLGVPETMLQQYGAVSPQVAEAMAQGAMEKTGAQATLAVTGIAGPDGGSAQKPVGLVYAACRIGSEVEVKELRFFGDRVTIKMKAVNAVLNFLRLKLLGLETPDKL